MTVGWLELLVSGWGKTMGKMEEGITKINKQQLVGGFNPSEKY